MAVARNGVDDEASDSHHDMQTCQIYCPVFWLQAFRSIADSSVQQWSARLSAVHQLGSTSPICYCLLVAGLVGHTQLHSLRAISDSCCGGTDIHINIPRLGNSFLSRGDLWQVCIVLRKFTVNKLVL